MRPDTLYVRRIGSLTVTTVSPGCEAIRISPSWRSTTIRREMSSPRPVPLPTSFVVKNGSNARACTFGRHPGSGVGDLDDNMLAFDAGRCPKRALALHGVDGVVHQVRPDLIELAWYRFDAWHVVGVVADNCDAVV